MLLMVPQGVEWHRYSLIERSQWRLELPFKLPGVWAEDDPPGLAQHILPVVVELKPVAEPAHQKQYFIPIKTQVGNPERFRETIEVWNPSSLPIILEYASPAGSEVWDQ